MLLNIIHQNKLGAKYFNISELGTISTHILIGMVSVLPKWTQCWPTNSDVCKSVAPGICVFLICELFWKKANINAFSISDIIVVED